MVSNLFSKQHKPEFQDELKIMATQIETINKQLANVNGGNSNIDTKSVEQKLTYIYEFLESMQQSLVTSEQASFSQFSSQIVGNLNKGLKQIYAKLNELSSNISSVPNSSSSSSHGSSSGATIQSSSQLREIRDMKKALESLISIYKDEVNVFKKQNEFLQDRLIKIEEKIDKLASKKK